MQAEVEPTFGSRLRSFLPVAALPNGIVVMIAIVFALIALIATSSSMAALPSTIAQFWLVVNLVPVQGDGHTIGYLPMLPAALLATVVAKRVYAQVKEKVSLADLGVLLLCVLLIPILLTLTAAAMLYDASVVYPVGVPNIALAVGMTVLLHGSAFVIGMGRRLWRAILRRFGMPMWLVDSALLGARGMAVVSAASLAVVIISLGVHYRAVLDSLDGFGSTAGVVGAIAISVLYLPNALVAAAAIMAGSEFHFGQGLFSLFGVNMVPLPPVPLLGALPAAVHPWATVLLVLMGLCVVYAVYRNIPRFLEGIVAAFFAGAITLILSVFASGTLGIYGSVGPNVWMTSGFVLAWFAVVISLAVAIVVLVSRRVGNGVSEDAGDAEKLEAAEHSDEPPVLEDAPENELVSGEAVQADAEDNVSEEEFESADEPSESIEELVEPETGDVVDAEETADEFVAESTEEDQLTEEEQELDGSNSAQPSDLEEDKELAEEPEQVSTPDSAGEQDFVEETLTLEPDTQSWHTDDFNGEDQQVDVDDQEVQSAVDAQVQQEALDEYQSIEVEQAPIAPKAKSEPPTKKRRRGGIFRRK